MRMDLKNRKEVENKVNSLIKELKKADCTELTYKEMGDLLNQIAQMPEYEDLYDEAADELIMAGINLEKCGCDPIRGKIPADKEKLIPDK